MSKLDAQRAMREANYAARQKAAGASTKPAPAAKAKPPVAPPATAAKSKTKAAPVVAAIDGATCGHKSMNGRACTREAGHSEKSHRYS